MTTYNELIVRAKEMGHELTPELRADLMKLSLVPDNVIRTRARKEFICGMAKKFQVPVGVVEVKLSYVGPFRPPSEDVS